MHVAFVEHSPQLPAPVAVEPPEPPVPPVPVTALVDVTVAPPAPSVKLPRRLVHARKVGAAKKSAASDNGAKEVLMLGAA